MAPSEAIEVWFDQIRMLDIESYPKAFVGVGSKKIAFSRPALRFGGRIEATVEIIEEKSIE